MVQCTAHITNTLCYSCTLSSVTVAVCIHVHVCLSEGKKIYFYTKKLENRVFQPSMQGVMLEKCSGSVLHVQTCPLTSPLHSGFVHVLLKEVLHVCSDAQ